MATMKILAMTMTMMMTIGGTNVNSDDDDDGDANGDIDSDGVDRDDARARQLQQQVAHDLAEFEVLQNASANTSDVGEKKSRGRGEGGKSRKRGSDIPQVPRTQGRLMNAVSGLLQQAMSVLPAHDVINPTEANRIKPGDYVVVFIAEAEGQTLRGTAISKSSMVEFYSATRGSQGL